MKKTGAFLILLFVFNFLDAQNLQIFNDGEDVSSDTIKIDASADTDPCVIHLNVKNNAATSIDVKVKKIEESIVDGASISLCWGVNCFSPTQYVTPIASTIRSGETDDSFHGDYFHYGNGGVTTAIYVFFDDANTDDSSYVVVQYTLRTSGMDLIELSNFSAPYPNPAADVINFYFSVNSEVILNIYNPLGKIIEEIPLTVNENNIQILTSTYAPGIYFYEFKKKNVVLENGKIVIFR